MMRLRQRTPKPLYIAINLAHGMYIQKTILARSVALPATWLQLYPGLSMLVPELFVTISGLDAFTRHMFDTWAGFLKEKVEFARPASSIHGYGHAERTLLHALLLSGAIFPGDSQAAEILAHAAVFHDTRRKNDGKDMGHGARAAVHYKQWCQSEGIKYFPRAADIMRYHDLDDGLGKRQITRRFGGRTCSLYAIFKDADALDRWRLCKDGLNMRYLRTKEALELVEFARRLVAMSSAVS